jgi:hypothetical protein
MTFILIYFAYFPSSSSLNKLIIHFLCNPFRSPLLVGNEDVHKGTLFCVEDNKWKYICIHLLSSLLPQESELK